MKCLQGCCCFDGFITQLNNVKNIVLMLTVVIITFELHALLIHYLHLYLFLMLNIWMSVSLENLNTTAHFIGCEDVIGKKQFQDNHHMWQMQQHIVYKPPACCSQTADISSFLSSTIFLCYKYTHTCIS